MPDTTHLATLTATIDNLPLINDQTMALLKLIDDPDSNFKILITRLPPEVTIRFLKMANSSVYGRQVNDINHALRILGFNAMRQSLVSSLIMDQFEKKLATSQFNLDKFHRHASFSASIATMLARALDYEKTAELFTAAMMHNVGKLVIAAYLPDISRQISDLKRSEKLNALTAERRVLGYTHAELGAAVLARFNIPEELCRAVRRHEMDMEIETPADEEHQLELILRAAVHLADRLTLPQGIEDPLELVAIFEEPLDVIRGNIRERRRLDILDHGYEKIFSGLLAESCDRIEAMLTRSPEENTHPDPVSRDRT